MSHLRAYFSPSPGIPGGGLGRGPSGVAEHAIAQGISSFFRHGVLLAALLCAGCVDWSGDVKTYRTLLDGKHPSTQPAFDPAQSLTLTEALARANADNETIASKGEDYIQALASKMRDAGTFLPTLTLGPSYTLSSSSGGNTIIFTGGGTGTGTGGIQIGSAGGSIQHQFTIPASASVTGSLANVSTLNAAGFTIEQQRQLLLDERETILLDVAQSYYTALKNERQSAVYEDSLKVKQEKMRDEEARLKLGAAKPLDLAQSQSDLAATQVQLTQSRTDAANARSALARLIGVPAVNGPLTDALIPPGNLPALDDWQRGASQNRQDLLAAQSAAEAGRLKVQAAIREYFPTVTINFDYFLYSDPSTGQRWTGGISGNVPIFSALAIEADIRSAWSQYRQSGLSWSLTRRQVIDDVNENYRNVTNNRQNIAMLEVEVAAAQKAFDLADRAYRLGSDSNLDRLTQQNNLLTAQLNLVSEQFNEKSNYLGLLRASGTLASVIKR